MKIRNFLVAFVLLGTLQLMGQTIKDFKILKGESSVEVVFDYTNMRLMNDNLTEKAYVTDKKTKMNDKNIGSGDLWANSWDRNKQDIWGPKFVVLLNKHVDKKVKFTQSDATSKYIVNVLVDWIYPGWDAGIVKQAAKVTTTITLVSRDKPSVVLAKHTFSNMPGNQFGSNFNNESRIAEGFAKTGKEFAKKIVKSL